MRCLQTGWSWRCRSARWSRSSPEMTRGKKKKEYGITASLHDNTRMLQNQWMSWRNGNETSCRPTLFPVGPSRCPSSSLLNLLFEDEDALPLLRGQHCDLFWGQLQDLHNQGSLEGRTKREVEWAVSPSKWTENAESHLFDVSRHVRWQQENQNSFLKSLIVLEHN